MPKYYWWKGTDLAAFVAELTAKGLENVRVEFHPQGEGGEKAMLFVRDTREGADLSLREHEDEGYNHAHPCPPDCE
jgi:hypothetical protein